MTTPTISAQGLTKKFGRHNALADVEFAVPEGSIYALVGTNGSGKTTLIKLLMNILRPTTGTAQVLGRDSRKFAGKDFTQIGYVSESQEMLEGMTVGAMLEYSRAFYPQWDQSLERQVVKQFALPLDRKIKHLSRGMKMKAQFASTLAYRPALMVLDEPFTGLDALVRDELIEELLERAPETTIFLSSHDLADIESFASHVAYLENGRMLFSEEMPVLSDRFREVTVTLEQVAQLPAKLPLQWLGIEAMDHVVRFTHSGFAGETSVGELRNAFPGAREIAIEPMPLRGIFLAMAKAAREPEPAE